MIAAHVSTKTIAALATSCALVGCASLDIERSIAAVDQHASPFTRGALQLQRNEEQQAKHRETVSELLGAVVSQDDAVRIALLNSASLQALLAEHWADAVSLSQSGRLPNPILTLERIRTPSETEIGRMLAFGLLDLLTLPQRRSIADEKLRHLQHSLAARVIAEVTETRQAWVAAVASQQTVAYAQQVLTSAEASAELARRMHAVGNFTKLQRARQHAFYADAATQAALAQHVSLAAKEALVRKLGLDAAQASRLKLPNRLPDLPAMPTSAEELSRAAFEERLDLKMAKAQLIASAKAESNGWLTSAIDIELALIRNTMIDRADGHRESARGAELSITLPVFDWGDARRKSLSARTLAAANQLNAVSSEASSQLRESYSAYRTAFDLAKHYRDEVVPLRKQISDENLLRYNGMLIGVFELIEDARGQVASVVAAINAQQQFWLADAGLYAAIAGVPLRPLPMNTSAAANEASASPH